MSDYVTDPALLSQLNGTDANGYVTDPSLLAQLNAKSQDIPAWQRLVRGIKEPVDALVQDTLHSLPQSTISKVNSVAQSIDNAPIIGGIAKSIGLTPLDTKQFDSDLANQETSYNAQRINAGPDIPRVIGNLIPQTIATIGAGGIPASSSILSNIGIGGSIGGVSSLLSPVYSNPKNNSDFWNAKGDQFLVGAATGGITAPLASGISRVISPNASTNPDVQKLISEGVTPTPGQLMGGSLKRIEDAATSIPVLGDVIKNAQRRAAGDLATASINRSLTPIGEKLPNGMNGRDAIGYAVDKLSNAYDNVLTKIGAVKPDGKFHTDLSNLSSMVQNAPKDISDQFNRIVQNEIIGRIDSNGVMTSEGLKAAESNLGQLANGAYRSGDFDKQMLGDAIKQAQSNLRDMLSRTSPGNAQELQSINTGYANLLRPQKAAASLGAESGNFTPAQLQSAVKSLDKSKNNRAFATGNALMQDLSDAGKNVLGGTVPDSGTPLRHAVEVGAAGLLGHSMLPASVTSLAAPAVAGAAISMAPYTPLGQKLAAMLLASRPQSAQTIAENIRKTLPAISMSGLPLANALFNYRQ